MAGDPLVCGVAVENEIFNQNGGVTQVRQSKRSFDEYKP